MSLSCRSFAVVLVLVGLFAWSVETEAAEYVYTNGVVGSCTGAADCFAVTKAFFQSGTCSTADSITEQATSPVYIGVPPWGSIRIIVSCNYPAGPSGFQTDYAGPGSVPPECTVVGPVVTCPSVCAVDGLSFIKSGTGAVPASFCDQGCSFSPEPGGANVVFQDGWIGSYTASGGCTPDDGGIDTGQNCIQTSGGTQYCVDNLSQENCGTVNGEYVCLDSVPQGSCVLTPGGQAICDSGSQTNLPDETITTDSGQTLDIFGSGTSTGGDAGGTGATTGAGDGTDPDSGTGTGGTGEAQPGDCDGTNCVGVLPAGNEAVDGYGTLFSTFYGRIEAAPIIAAYSGISGSMPVGTCQGIDSDPLAFLNGEVLTIDIHCSLWPTIVPVLSGVMLAVWSLIGGLIILRA